MGFETPQQKARDIIKEQREALDKLVGEYCTGSCLFTDEEGSMTLPEKEAEPMLMSDIVELVKACLLESYIPKMNQADQEDLRQDMLISVAVALRDKRIDYLAKSTAEHRAIRIGFIVQVLKSRQYIFTNNLQGIPRPKKRGIKH